MKHGKMRVVSAADAVATPKLTDKALCCSKKGEAADAASGVCAWHGFARDDGYAGTGQRRKEPAADDDAQDGRGRPADSFAPELRLGLSGSGIAFTVPISGANKRVFADGAAGLSGKAEAGNEEGAYAGKRLSDYRRAGQPGIQRK